MVDDDDDDAIHPFHSLSGRLLQVECMAVVIKTPRASTYLLAASSFGSGNKDGSLLILTQTHHTHSHHHELSTTNLPLPP